MSSVDTPPNPPQYSEQFNSDDSDVILQSSDGVLFKFKKTNLTVHSPVFASAQSVSQGAMEPIEVVELSETAPVLELLLRFMSPEHQPSLKEMDFEHLCAFAEAVNKYEVYSALNPCLQELELALPVHPIEIFLFAVKHDHTDLVDQAAPFTLSLDIDNVMETLPTNIFRVWVRYYDHWQRALHDIRFPKPPPTTSEDDGWVHQPRALPPQKEWEWVKVYTVMIKDLSRDLMSLEKLLVESGAAASMYSSPPVLSTWAAACEHIEKGVPKFTSLM